MAIDKILIESTPKIVTNSIVFRDTDHFKKENGETVFDPAGRPDGYVSQRSILIPIVYIGTTRVPESMIKSLTVWQNDLLPIISLTIIEDGAIFGAGFFPTANPIVSIYVSSRTKGLKGLGGDYLITSISSMPIPGTFTTVYTLSGELHVPKLNGNFSKSYSKKSSRDVLKAVADDLGLGFAHNQQENTKDEMTWLMPNYTYKSFINHVKKLTYLSDDAFFDCFIDRYYTLNFINVEKMFSQDKDLDKGLAAIAQMSLDVRKIDLSKSEELNPLDIDMLLTNSIMAKGTEFYVTEYARVSQHGEILANHGLRKHAYWYNHGSNQDPNTGDSANFVNHFTEPLITPAAADGLLSQRTVIPEFADAQSVGRIWNGVDYHNAHGSYKFASLINRHNHLETQKNQLKVRTLGINSNIIRGSRIAVGIFLDRQTAQNSTMTRSELADRANVPSDIERDMTDSRNSATGTEYDKSLSGFYYVSSIKYSYLDGEFFTEMILSRRHWLLPAPQNLITF